ncbi:MAG: hypothetical protein GXO26_08095 [Crenarchaeota archaeon]|nr:hypothetical protein [Thermoproteota archaeon]
MRLYVPSSLDEARSVVPGIDEERFRKWRREGAVELVLEEVYEVDNGSAYVFRDRTELALTGHRVELVERSGRSIYVLCPDAVYVLVTERINVPRRLLPIDFRPRSSIVRAGWNIATANIDPGFRGRLIVTLYTGSRVTLYLEDRCRIVQVRFLELDSEVEGYSGQWNE